MSDTLGPIQQCRSCREPIVWTVTKHSGKRLPVNPEPTEKGDVLVEHRGSVLYSGIVLAAYREQQLKDGNPLYLSHFATCPQSAQWRKR
ncbi:hypothetical protein P3H15_32735 [Rhodococcus sp. T2V]|uniref:hypothetical protein n=1 Tax=Rhodococcus sp. T2V TaxID=3034164 RepID=UPI0023E113B2|nr:hypothetical protein [Rhodococcus sp. T2V]MDF3309787.1 hypothetical protein [Rhodococcus sp. T2V]